MILTNKDSGKYVKLCDGTIHKLFVNEPIHLTKNTVTAGIYMVILGNDIIRFDEYGKETLGRNKLSIKEFIKKEEHPEYFL